MTVKFASSWIASRKRPMTETPGHFQTIDWFVLIGYFAGTLGIGFYFYRKTRSTEGFTAANRSLPGWLCGLSIFATFLSSISYLALPGKSFMADWNPFVFSLSIPLVTWIAVRYFLPYYRGSGEVSAYAALEHRFGVWARMYASVFYLLTQIARIGVVMYLMALPMQVIFGWDIYTILIVTGVCVTVYSFVGGILAVIWTDAIQAIVLMAGAVISLVFMLVTMPGGPRRVFDVAAEHGKFSLGSFGAGVDGGGVAWVDFGAATILVVLLYGTVINLQNFGIDQSYIQRYIASSSDREARRSLWLGGLLYVPVSALFFFIGTTLFVYYGAHESRAVDPLQASVRAEAGGEASRPDKVRDIDEVRLIVARQRLLQAGLSPDDDDFQARQGELAQELHLTDIGDRVFPHFIAKHLWPGLTGLLVAAVFAAAMSTISTSLNSSATLIMSDYFKRFVRPNAGERQSMLVLYAATVLWGVLGTGLALLLVRLTESALDIWWTLSGIFGGGMVGLFLLGMISKRARNPQAATAVLVGLLVIAWMTVSPSHWGLLSNQATFVEESPVVLAYGADVPARIQIGDRVHVHYREQNPDTGSSTARHAMRTIKALAGTDDGADLTLHAPIEGIPEGTARLYVDNIWYHLRSPFHKFMIIVVGSLTILLAGLLLSRWGGRKPLPANLAIGEAQRTENNHD
jgi:SSS family solute:Na+ symporter